MRRDIARYFDDDGGRCDAFFDGGAHDATQLDDVVSHGSWNGTALDSVFRKSFRYWPAAALPAGWQYQYDPFVPLRTLFIVAKPIQSNGEGRGLRTEASTVVHLLVILRNTYPYDENLSGPGGDQCGGPLIAMADRLMTLFGPSGLNLYDRVCICSVGQGNQSLANEFGTDGTDGVGAAQMNDPDVLGGIEGDTLANGNPLVGPPPIMRPGDDYILHVNIGEGDAAGGNVSSDPETGWAAECLQSIAWFTDVAFPSSICRGITIAGLAPTEELGANAPEDQARWDAVRAQQLTLHAPAASPPRVVVSYTDAEKKPGDEIHYSMAGQERMGAACADALADALARAFLLGAFPGEAARHLALLGVRATHGPIEGKAD